MEDYVTHFEELCAFYELGNVIQKTYEVKGGLLHKMFCVETERGKYAVKLLNPLIMQRPKVLEYFIDSEKAAASMVNVIPAVSAIQIHKEVLFKHKDQYHLVYHWVDGVMMRNDQIETKHCSIMGDILAKIHIHKFDVNSIPKPMADDYSPSQWEAYLKIGKEQKQDWVPEFEKMMDHILEIERKREMSSKTLNREMVMSHRDLDPKNILWQGYSPYVIDWESTGYVNPNLELLEVAMYWSCDENQNLNEQKFLSLFNSYNQIKSIHCNDWCPVLYGVFNGKKIGRASCRGTV